MPYCAAFGCTTKAKRGSGISLFGFPKDPKICRQWVSRINRKDFRPSAHSRLCSHHFESSQYDRDPSKLAKYGYCNALPRLKNDAIPTIFLHKPTKPPSERSRKAIEKRRNRQSGEVKNSHWMEIEGLKRGLRHLDEWGVPWTHLVSDRHSQIKKYMKDERPEKVHNFDVWHCAKGVESKLEQAAKKTEGRPLRSWIKSIVNHMYWVAASSPDDEDGSLKRQKWLSIVNHISNIHEGHGDLFKKCSHPPIQNPKLKAWLKKGSIPHKILHKMVSRNLLLKDVGKLSPVHQTYGLEVFHNVVIRFAPKHTHYSYWGMYNRLILAALHYNENGDKPQLVKKDGTESWRICFLKSKKGDVTVAKPVKQQSTYGYVQVLMGAVVARRLRFPSYNIAEKDVAENMPPSPAPLTARYAPVDKEELVQQRKSRFAKD